jgi:hypothetical protein
MYLPVLLGWMQLVLCSLPRTIQLVPVPGCFSVGTLHVNPQSDNLSSLELESGLCGGVKVNGSLGINLGIPRQAGGTNSRAEERTKDQTTDSSLVRRTSSDNEQW